MTRALFLDRDGVVNVDKSYVYKIGDFEFIDGIFDLCESAQSHGFKIIIATNQSGIARGYYTVEDFNRLTEYMIGKFKSSGIEITDVFYCPYLSGPDRKPNPGMFIKARDKYCIDMKKSVSVGDKQRDIQPALNAGIIRNYLLSVAETPSTAYATVSSLRDLCGVFDF